MTVSFEVLIVFALLVVALVLFATERVSFDVVSLLILATLLLSGILTPEEGLSGFSDPATLTIAAMFVISAALNRTGGLDLAGRAFRRIGKRDQRLGFVSMLVVVALLSAFINNTAAVAIFIPIAIRMGRDLGVSPSRLLMPLSFVAMLGGVCTLIGTSTNLLVSSIAEAHGQEPFGMFEFAPLGVVFLVSGFLYMLFIGGRLVPERRESEELTRSFEMRSYLTDIALLPESDQIGEPIDEATLLGDLDLDVIEVLREREDGLTGLEPESPLRAGDVIRIRGGIGEIEKLLRREDVSVAPGRQWDDVEFDAGRQSLVEIVIAPDSDIEGDQIRDVDLAERFGAILLAVRHEGRLKQEDLAARVLSAGDSLLLAMPEERLGEVERDRSFILVSEYGIAPYRRSKLPIAVLILGSVVVAAAAGLVPIVVSAATGVLALLLTGCLTTQEAYEAVNWKVIMLLAGVLPLGTAMEKTGGAEILSGGVTSLFGALGPEAVVSGFFLLAVLLSNVISNQATAALLAPVAIEAAASFGASPRPFLMAVTFAASLSFMTPVGYQTNTMIYGPGQFRFTDFTRVGTPLNILLWILGTVLIPIVWPLGVG